MRIAPVMATATCVISLALTACAAAPEDPTAGFGSIRKPSGVGIDSPIRDLVNNPAALAVLRKDMPGLVDDPQFDMVKSMTLRQLARFPQAGLNEAKLMSIQADLVATSAAPRAAGASAKAANVAAVNN